MPAGSGMNQETVATTMCGGLLADLHYDAVWSYNIIDIAVAYESYTWL